MRSARLALLASGLAALAAWASWIWWVHPDPPPGAAARALPSLRDEAGASAGAAEADRVGGDTRSPAAGAADTAPRPGAIRIVLRDAALTVQARQVRRLVLLDELSARFGFALVVGPGVPDPVLDVDRRGVSLEAVLGGLLADTEHALRYAPDGPDGAGPAVEGRLVEVAIGPQPAVVARASEPGVLHERSQARPASGSASAGDSASEDFAEDDPAEERGERERGRPEPERVRLERDPRQQERQQEQLAGGGLNERVRAAAQLDVDDGGSLAALRDALLHDPSSQVRIQAARRIGFAETEAALPLLSRALADPDPEVVREVIDSMVFLQDAGAIEPLERLRTHPDPQLRAEALDAIETLR